MGDKLLGPYIRYIDGLVQDCSNSSALAMELLQSCTEPSIWNQRRDGTRCKLGNTTQRNWNASLQEHTHMWDIEFMMFALLILAWLHYLGSCNLCLNLFANMDNSSYFLFKSTNWNYLWKRLEHCLNAVIYFRRSKMKAVLEIKIQT